MVSGRKMRTVIDIIHRDWVERPCPVCKSSRPDSRKLEMRSKIPAENHSFNEVMSNFVGLRQDQIFFSYFRCLKCKVLYCPWYFSNDQLEILYNEMPDNLMGENVDVSSRTQESYALSVARFCKESPTLKNYLELGPDIGLVGKKLGESLTFRTALFVEPNQNVHATLVENSKKFENINVVSFLSEAPRDYEFDIAIAVHVFDHLLFPADTLQKLSTMGSEDRVLGIVVHNERSFVAKILGKKWPPYCLQHPQLYNSETLSLLLSNSQWSMKHLERTKNHYSLRNFTKNLLAVFGLPQSFAKNIPKWEFSIPIGNILVIAQKT